MLLISLFSKADSKPISEILFLLSISTNISFISSIPLLILSLAFFISTFLYSSFFISLVKSLAVFPKLFLGNELYLIYFLLVERICSKIQPNLTILFSISKSFNFLK